MSIQQPSRFNQGRTAFSRTPLKKSVGLAYRGNRRFPSTAYLQEGKETEKGRYVLPYLPIPVAASLPRLYTQAQLVPIQMRSSKESNELMVDEASYTVDLHQAHHMVLQGKKKLDHTSKTSKPKATLCFVVKRPGCVLCHEQGITLTKMLADFEEPNESVAAWAVVKETGVDDAGLLSMQQEPFAFQFYRDSNLNLYKALGDRKVSTSDVALRLEPALKRAQEQKGIRGAAIEKGEGFTLGGIMIFDEEGTVKYAHQEQFGKELPTKEITMALRHIIEQSSE